MKTFLILLMALTANASSSKRYEPSPTPTATPIVAASPVAGRNITFKCESCTAVEARNIAIVEAAIPAIVNSKCFADFYIDPKFTSRLEQTNGLTRAEVVEKIRSSTVQNIPIIFYYPTWRQSKNVIGYTYEGRPEIYLNKTFRQGNAWGACAEISNELHEVTHKMGFDHDYKATARRPYTVPYRANAAVDHCCKDSDYPTYGK